jgi:hypothetical protein
MLDFLVVASTFEFVTHLKFKIFKTNRKQNYKSKKEINKRKKKEKHFSWADSQAARPSLTPLPWLVGLTTPRSAHTTPPFLFFCPLRVGPARRSDKPPRTSRACISFIIAARWAQVVRIVFANRHRIPPFAMADLPAPTGILAPTDSALWVYKYQL